MRVLFLVMLSLYIAITIWSFVVLPDEVAANFDLDGEVTSWCGKIGSMLVTVVPTLFTIAVMMLSPLLIVKVPAKYVNIPHKDYWLSEQHIGSAHRRMETIMAEFCVVFLAFMSMIGYAVTRANLRDPVRLEGKPILVSAVVIVLYTIYWVFKLYVVFRVPGSKDGDPT